MKIILKARNSSLYAEERREEFHAEEKGVIEQLQ
jgi:hypothetical protein